jgi:hypothetical protein
MDQEVWCRDEMRLWFDKYADKSVPLYTSSNNSNSNSTTSNSNSNNNSAERTNSSGFDQVLSKYMVPVGQFHNFNYLNFGESAHELISLYCWHMLLVISFGVVTTS